ncbi:uncharacterized protein EV422DRAFT_571634 [Fimicolochytrium jonesii]|uniref:uncharacterized protein n=1 Tax=Fimicolochytrium jonesii TaxID=1396493 RepID=UPI0022FE7D02|nr:uncharacterized protein EV422DRAFT_571634 [Fimicolochytrium jonesii]KAI8816451.1 hypothetical protein EV422DRAFT_571634 [Fimicolochytrium jonesii]
MDTLDKWVSEKLSERLGMNKAELEQVTSYLMSMQSPDECVGFLMGMVGDDATALAFIEEFNERRFPKFAAKGVWNAPLKAEVRKGVHGPDQAAKNALGGYRKAKEEEDYIVGKASTRNDISHAPPPNAASEGTLLSDKIGGAGPRPADASRSPRAATGKAKQKKGKDVSAALDELDRMVKVGKAPPGYAGRVVCECLAAVHGLVTNCITCGKIVCRLEGEGPCPCCGSDVQSKQQQFELLQERASSAPSKAGQKTKARAGKDAYTNARYGRAAGAQIPSVAASKIAAMPTPDNAAQFPTLMSDEARDSLRRAEQQTERLLDYQRNSVARTKVFDQASDFSYEDAAANKWLSLEERALATKRLQEQRRVEEEQKRRRVITIDLKGRRVVAEKAPVHVPDMDFSSAASSARKAAAETEEEITDFTGLGNFYNPSLGADAPRFIPTSSHQSSAKSSKASKSGEAKGKVPIQRRKRTDSEQTPVESGRGSDDRRPITASANSAEKDDDAAEKPALSSNAIPEKHTDKKTRPSRRTANAASRKPQLKRLQHDLEGFGDWGHTGAGEEDSVGFEDRAIPNTRAEDHGDEPSCVAPNGRGSSGAKKSSKPSQSGTVTLPDFLAFTKAFLAKAGKSKTRQHITIIIGNEAADLDSVVCAISLAYLRAQQKGKQNTVYVPLISILRADFPLRTECPFALHAASPSTDLVPHLTFLDEIDLDYLDKAHDVHFVLVDHNALAPTLERFAGRVVGVVDHHVDEGLYTDQKGDVRMVKAVGSATTLVAGEWRRALSENGNSTVKPTLLTGLAMLMLQAILIDTVNLVEAYGRATPEDREAVRFLTPYARGDITTTITQQNERDETWLQHLFSAVHAAKTNITHLSTPDLIRKDYKGWVVHPTPGTNKTAKLGISSVGYRIQGSGGWAAREGGKGEDGMRRLVTQCREFAGKVGVDVYVLMTATEVASSSDSSSATVFKRELLLLFPTSTVSEQQQTELVTKIEASTLDLAFITQIDAGARLYEQRNVRSSRKQVQPVFEEVIKAVYA